MPQNTTKRLLFVLSRSPHSGSLAHDCLDAAMTGALLNQTVSLLFIADGLYQLTEPASRARIESLKELADIALYVTEGDLAARHLTLDTLGLDATALRPDETGAFFDQHDQILSF